MSFDTEITSLINPLREQTFVKSMPCEQFDFLKSS